ncbi:MAG: RNA polymerase sigma factor [candidate division KSB1 bacterium]|nr:RNA polymerase sigma factor [candidate division KSB1 bacterium]MDZ7272495.1 RNA polymerase sigma factor [candidate division KSB1 bacterium]MDZ7284481.1 RNA polymerase sigma factor [candidate division KSB1 bacterium]MDZ7297123.1 RNA polymerase sigma factor [candidate division KSB1 bacterium]MDZ7306571.1 RNA polymerase sigma factor [candidate division KSB1 bacterium]
MPGENTDKHWQAGDSRGGKEIQDWERLLADAKSGDSAALAMLCRHVRKCARAFVRHDRLPSGLSDEDFAQEVIAAFLGKLHSIRHLPAWLGVVCTATRKRFIRKRYRECSESLEAMFETPGRDLPELQLSHETARLENRLEIELLLQHLQPEQRLVIVMRVLDGWEYDDIAQHLKKPIGAVRLLYFRAKKKLFSLMHPNYGEGRHHGLDAHRARKR